MLNPTSALLGPSLRTWASGGSSTNLQGSRAAGCLAGTSPPSTIPAPGSSRRTSLKAFCPHRWALRAGHLFCPVLHCHALHGLQSGDAPSAHGELRAPVQPRPSIPSMGFPSRCARRAQGARSGVPREELRPDPTAGIRGACRTSWPHSLQTHLGSIFDSPSPMEQWKCFHVIQDPS